MPPAVLDAIPETVPSDFGHDVIPAMIAGGAKIYGYRMIEKLWWIDTPADYEWTVREFSHSDPSDPCSRPLRPNGHRHGRKSVQLTPKCSPLSSHRILSVGASDKRLHSSLRPFS